VSIVFKCIYITCDETILRRANDGDNVPGESSAVKNEDGNCSDNPFVEVVSKNAMPTPPKEKKVYLEDFENFTVKYGF